MGKIRQLFALLSWTFVILAVATGTAKAASISKACSSAHDSYASAKAAQTSADVANALALYRTAIEQFEACRSQEDLNTSPRLEDTSLEADALIAAASIAVTYQEMERAHALLIGATGLLTELCTANTLPSDISSQVTSSVLGQRRFAGMVGIPEFGACASVQIPGPSPTP